MNITWAEAKIRARKPREIWSRRLLCDPTTPLVYLMARYTKLTPVQATLGSLLLVVGTGLAFVLGHMLLGAILAFIWFIADSVDGKLNRIQGNDDTYRGMLDYIFDGVGCVAIVVGLGLHGDTTLLLLLLSWMAMHYLAMKFTSAAYRLKVQFGDRDIWLANTPNAKGLLGFYSRFVNKTGTYPHPTIGESTLLIFVVGPILYHVTGTLHLTHLVTFAGILCIIPETVGAGIIVYILAKRGK